MHRNPPPSPRPPNDTPQPQDAARRGSSSVGTPLSVPANQLEFGSPQTAQQQNSRLLQSVVAHNAPPPQRYGQNSMASGSSSRRSTYGVPGVTGTAPRPKTNNRQTPPHPFMAFNMQKLPQQQTQFNNSPHKFLRPPVATPRTPIHPSTAATPSPGTFTGSFLPIQQYPSQRPSPRWPSKFPRTHSNTLPPQLPHVPPTMMNRETHVRAPPLPFAKVLPQRNNVSYPSPLLSPRIELSPPASIKPNKHSFRLGDRHWLRHRSAVGSAVASPIILSPRIEPQPVQLIPVHQFIPGSPQSIYPQAPPHMHQYVPTPAPPPDIMYEEVVLPGRHIHEKIIEVPEIEIKEKIIEYPQLCIEEKIIEVPRTHIQQRIIQVPKPVTVEKIVPVPEIEYRINTRHHLVEIPEVAEQEVITEIEVPTIVEVPVPNVVKVQIPVEIERFIPYPIEVTAKYPFKEVKHLKVKEKEIPLPIYVPRFVETPMIAEEMGHDQFHRSVDLNTRLAELSQQSHVLQQQLQDLLPLAEPIGRISTGAPKTAYAPKPPPLASNHVLSGESLFYPPTATSETPPPPPHHTQLVPYPHPQWPPQGLQFSELLVQQHAYPPMFPHHGYPSQPLHGFVGPPYGAGPLYQPHNFGELGGSVTYTPTGRVRMPRHPMSFG